MKQDYKQKLIDNGYSVRHESFSATALGLAILIGIGFFIGWLWFKLMTGGLI